MNFMLLILDLRYGFQSLEASLYRPGELLGVATRHTEAPQARKCRVAVPTFSGLWGPFSGDILWPAAALSGLTFWRCVDRRLSVVATAVWSTWRRRSRPGWSTSKNSTWYTATLPPATASSANTTRSRLPTSASAPICTRPTITWRRAKFCCPSDGWLGSRCYLWVSVICEYLKKSKGNKKK